MELSSLTGYECIRTQESVDGPPDCFSDLVCENGGTATFEADKCWCICPDSWQGDFDCSKPTRDVYGLPAGSDICELCSLVFPTKNINIYAKCVLKKI